MGFAWSWELGLGQTYRNSEQAGVCFQPREVPFEQILVIDVCLLPGVDFSSHNADIC